MHLDHPSNSTDLESTTNLAAQANTSTMVSWLLDGELMLKDKTTGSSRTPGESDGETKDTSSWPETETTTVELQPWQLCPSANGCNTTIFFIVQSETVLTDS
jgi:hypothetical protein